MEVLSWLWWLVVSLVGVVWTVVWFLISGWVSTLLHTAILVVVIASEAVSAWVRERIS